MTTSGVNTFTIYQSDLVADSMICAGVLAAGESPTDDDYQFVLRTLNMMVKAWNAGANPTARGLKCWLRKRGTLILQDAQSVYSLGPTGDHASASVAKTTLTSDSLTSDTTLTVASATGIATTYIIGVVLDSGTVHWDVVNGAPSGLTVTITTGVASKASSGNRVFCYQTILQRPVNLLSMLLRDKDGNDSPMQEVLLGTYEAIGNKTDEGDPSRYYWENQLDNVKVYLDFRPSDTSKTIEFVYHRPLDDFVNVGDTPDFPQEWYEALKYNLAARIGAEYQLPISDDLKILAQLSLAEANSFFPETSDLYFEPDRPY